MQNLNSQKQQKLPKKGGEPRSSSSPETAPPEQQPEPGSIELLHKTLRSYTRKLTNGVPNDKVVKGIFQKSSELASKYEEKFLTELQPSFRANCENECWKNCFYASIEAFKKQACNGGPHSPQYQEVLLDFIDKAIVFYEDLLKKLEKKFGIKYDKVFRWPTDRLTALNELNEGILLVTANNDPHRFDSFVLRSAQRHFIYLGDLHRYKVQNGQTDGNGHRDFSMARRYYFEAYVLEPLNGHPLNQCAVIATYERNWVDMLFYYVRSLSVRLPFDSARESLETALNSLREPSKTYENWIWERKAQMSKEKKGSAAQKKKKTATANSRGPFTDIFQQQNKKGGGGSIGKKLLENYQEIWIHPDTKMELKKDETGEQPAHNLVEGLFFNPERGVGVQKKAIAHLLHCAGILISGIGIEQFGRVSQLALDELTEFMHKNETILSPAKIVKIIFLFTFSVHNSKAGASQTLVEEQKRSAVGMLLSTMGRVLNMVCSDLDKIGLYILAGRLSKKFLRTIPSLCFLLYWFWRNYQCIFTYGHQQKHFEVWHRLAQLCNKLHQIRVEHELAQCTIGTFGECKQGYSEIILPEFYLLSPYFDVFPKYPNPVLIQNDSLGIDLAEKDTHFLTVQARFGLILHIAEQLAANDEFGMFKMTGSDDGTYAKFEAIEMVDNEPVNNENEEQQPLKDSTKVAEAITATDEDGINSVPPMTSSMTEDEYELKRQLLTEAQSAFTHRWVIEVRPKYLVPDTNTFIDHLDQIQLLVDSKMYTLLIPTTVIEELDSLQLGVPILPGSTLLSRELLNPEGSKSAFLMKNAKAAMEWLRQASQQAVPNLKTVTSNGNILQRLSFAAETGETGYKKRSNDDRILSVCINLCKHLNKSSSAGGCIGSEEETKLERTVVLLTEDRGLSAKAIAEKIPVRTIPNFTQWALKDKKVRQKSG